MVINQTMMQFLGIPDAMKTRPLNVGEQIAPNEPAGGMNQQNVVSAGCGDSTTSRVEHLTVIVQTSANKPPRVRFSLEEKQALESTLLLNAKQQLPQLKELLNQVDNEWGIEDGVYRFYHGSYKVYHLQGAGSPAARSSVERGVQRHCDGRHGTFH